MGAVLNTFVSLQVMRKVEQMKIVMEKQMLEEIERQKQAEIVARKQKEVTTLRAFKPHALLEYVCSV